MLRCERTHRAEDAVPQKRKRSPARAARRGGAAKASGKGLKATVGKRKAASRKPAARRATARKTAPRKAARKAAPRKAAARKTPVRKPAARKRSAAPRPRRSAPPPQFDQGTPPREHEDAETLIPGAREDDLAEELGEESVEAATSGQSPAEENLNEEVPEETGGPFVETSADEETGHHTDGSRRDK
jgi:hypothetical protein